MVSTHSKFKRTSSAGKVMAIVFWDCDGVIMVDFFEKENLNIMEQMCI